MSSSKPNVGVNWKFALAWAIATATGVFLGGFIGLYAGFTAASIADQATQPGSTTTIQLIVAVGVGFAIAAAITGAIQQQLLKRTFAQAQSWMLFTLLGTSLTAVAIHLTSTISGVPTDPGGANGGICIGLGVGLAQWFLLKQYSSRAIWWIPTHAIAGGVSLAMISGLAPLAPIPYGILTAGVITWILQAGLNPRQRNE